MKQQNFQKGRRGEDIAEVYLKKRGFGVVEKNFRTKFGEIDLVVAKGGVLHFVEVKLKVGSRFGAPEEMINKKKILQVAKIGEAYLFKKSELAAKYSRVQVDAVCIVTSDDGVMERVCYYENLTSEL